jgi:hypothetical protein
MQRPDVQAKLRAAHARRGHTIHAIETN